MSIWDQFAAPKEDDDELIKTPAPEPEEEEEEELLEEEPEEEEEVEDPEEEEEEEPEPAQQHEDADDDDDFSFAPVINDLAEKGILYYDPEKEYVDGDEGFEEVVEDTVLHRFDEMLSGFSPTAQKVIEIELAGGNAREALETYGEFDYAEVPLEDPDNQEQLIVDHFEALGYEQEDIVDEVTRIKETGDRELLAKAKVAQKYLVKKQAAEREAYSENVKKAKEQEAAQRREDLANLQQDIISTKEISGIRLDKRMQKQLFEHMTKPVGPKGETQLVLNRKSKEKQLAAALFDMMGYDASDIERKAATKVAGGLKKSLSRYQDTNATKLAGSRQVTSPKDSIKIPKGVWDRGYSED